MLIFIHIVLEKILAKSKICQNPGLPLSVYIFPSSSLYRDYLLLYFPDFPRHKMLYEAAGPRAS